MPSLAQRNTILQAFEQKGLGLLGRAAPFKPGLQEIVSSRHCLPRIVHLIHILVPSPPLSSRFLPCPSFRVSCYAFGANCPVRSDPWVGRSPNLNVDDQGRNRPNSATDVGPPPRASNVPGRLAAFRPLSLGACKVVRSLARARGRGLPDSPFISANQTRRPFIGNLARHPHNPDPSRATSFSRAANRVIYLFNIRPFFTPPSFFPIFLRGRGRTPARSETGLSGEWGPVEWMTGVTDET